MNTSNHRPTQLPIAVVAAQVCDALHKGNVVLQAEPGAGKSTGLPLELLKSGFDGKIIMLEPRRLAALNVATRLATQLNEPLGQTVGLRMRGRTEFSKNTKLEVVTEGVLTRILQNDPLLEGVAVVVFDEFHERSLHADLGLALCRDVQQGVREDLRLLFMSATLESEALCAHLDVASPIVCEVRQHPVDIIWQGESRAPLPASVASTVSKALDVHHGDILVFLPGVAEIEKTAKLVESQLPGNVKLHRLHSGVNAEAQREATAPNKDNTHRRVILATSIAETSLTIDGVRIVIDAGVERRSRIDSVSGIERLETVMASQASATQRAGRAGRTDSGVCYRLWSESSHHTRAVSWQPEVFRADLSSLVIEVGQWGVTDIQSLPWIDTPPLSAIERAKTLLQSLDLWGDDGLTERGRAVAKLPLPPRLGHMLLWGSEQGISETATKLAALLEEIPRTRGADLSQNLQRPTQWQKRRATQLKQLLPATANNSKGISLVEDAANLLARAFPDRIAKRRPGADGRYLLSGGSGALLPNEDPLSQSDYLVVAALGGQGAESRIFAALPINEQQLVDACGDIIDCRDSVDWDDTHERVITEKQLCIGAVVIERKPLTNIENDLRTAALISAIRRKGLLCLDWTENVKEWQARVQRMRALEGDTTGFSSVDDTALIASLEDWLQPYLARVSNLKALKKVDVLAALKATISYPQQQQLDEYLPHTYTVPSGSRHKLRYACEGSPVLSVKLQEMFGCRENPTIANGRINLKVELLSPARRPVQITEDLGNFWSSSYIAVKKDLAGRYPKHPWPDDPLNAQATAYAKPRKR